MLKSLKEKVVPSLIAMLIVGGFGAFVATKVMANQIATLQEETAKKASVEGLTNLKDALNTLKEDTTSEDEELREELKEKANKEVQALILDKLNKMDDKLDALITASN